MGIRFELNALMIVGMLVALAGGGLFLAVEAGAWQPEGALRHVPFGVVILGAVLYAVGRLVHFIGRLKKRS